jgi:hypothetical protein
VAAFLEILLQQREAGNAVAALGDDFAVDEGGLGAEPGDRVGDGRKFSGPVEPFARQQLDLAAIEPRLDAIAVELDLMDPGIARRCFFG